MHTWDRCPSFRLVHKKFSDVAVVVLSLQMKKKSQKNWPIEFHSQALIFTQKLGENCYVRTGVWRSFVCSTTFCAHLKLCCWHFCCVWFAEHAQERSHRLQAGLPFAFLVFGVGGLSQLHILTLFWLWCRGGRFIHLLAVPRLWVAPMVFR